MAQRVVCVVGPTASGKTKMGVALAKRFNGEVVSVDSMQIYRGMEIGTAAPTPEEMAMATDLFVLCVKMVSVDKLLESK